MEKFLAKALYGVRENGQVVLSFSHTVRLGSKTKEMPLLDFKNQIAQL